MGTLKDIYDIIADLASRATSKKHKQEIEGLKSRIAELERNHQKEIAELEARLKGEAPCRNSATEAKAFRADSGNAEENAPKAQLGQGLLMHRTDLTRRCGELRDSVTSVFFDVCHPPFGPVANCLPLAVPDLFSP
jgi:DNA repair exonuclease SbcCD ATPase subunit